MTGPLLYAMFKEKTKHPLHAAVRLQREDVVFLYLIEYSQEVSHKDIYLYFIGMFCSLRGRSLK